MQSEYTKTSLKVTFLAIILIITSNFDIAATGYGDNDNVKDISTIDVSKEASKDIPSINSVLNNINTKVDSYFKMSGLIIERYDATTNKDAYDSFNIMCFRFFINGDITDDFFYKIQLELAGSPKLLNAWIQWKKFKYFQVRAGQMYRNFGFETPYNPYYLGMSDFSQAIEKFSGFNDRIGSGACSNARDCGVLLIGDLFEYNKYNLLRYELGVFNGNGINQKDNNNSKDVIASLYFQPIRNLLIGGSGWIGEYGAQGKSVDRKRWCAGVKYEGEKYSFRSEYLYSLGKKYEIPDSPSRADGWYAAVGKSVAQNIKFYLKYDVYRDDKTRNTQTNRYFAALSWELYKRILLQGTYFYTEQKAPGLSNFNTFSAQLMFTF
ncbi:MAG: porin [Bacteroidales bacterium]|nr:porin [Bacteroidales bacterium]